MSEMIMRALSEADYSRCAGQWEWDRAAMLPTIGTIRIQVKIFKCLFPRPVCIKPGSIGLLLVWALVLLGHWAGLSWLRQQQHHFKPLVMMAPPILTRMIEAAPAPVRLPKPTSRRVAASARVTQPAQAPVVEPPNVLAAPVAVAQDPPGQEEVGGSSESAVPGPGEPDVAEPLPETDSWPVDTRLSYRLTGYYRGQLYGSAQVQWQREQNRYQVRIDMSMALLLRASLISQGDVTEAGLVPRVYQEQLLGSEQSLLFDGAKVKFLDGTELAKPQALQDTASQFVELTRRFSSGREELKVGRQVQVWLARPQGMALWTYDVIAQETLQTAEFGALPAFHLRPRPIANPRGVISAELWFAPSLQHLPVRVRVAIGADSFVDLLVERIEQGAAQPVMNIVQPFNP